MTLLPLQPTPAESNVRMNTCTNTPTNTHKNTQDQRAPKLPRNVLTLKLNRSVLRPDSVHQAPLGIKRFIKRTGQTGSENSLRKGRKTGLARFFCFYTC